MLGFVLSYERRDLEVYLARVKRWEYLGDFLDLSQDGTPKIPFRSPPETSSGLLSPRQLKFWWDSHSP
jgi:hypothetical protein